MAAKERKRRLNKRRRQSRQRHPLRITSSREQSDYGGGPREDTLKHRAAALAEIIQAYPQQIAFGLASREESGWIYGRLYLVGAINYDQRIAAERLNKSVVTYRRLLRRGQLRAANIEAIRVGTGEVEDLSIVAEKAFERASAEYDRRISALKECGENVFYAVMESLETDRLTDLDLIRRGLDALR